MNTEKRRGGYLATADGVKKLKEAKGSKKYTYEQIKDAAQVTIDQVKRLFNPQWGNGKYKIGEEAVSLICGVLELKPEEIVSDWYALETKTNDSELSQIKTNEASTPYKKALQLIEQAERESATELDLSGMELTKLPPEIGRLTKLTKLVLGKLDQENYQWIGNNLTSLPAEIVQLTNLTELNLSNNSLSSLPTEIVQLTNLTELNLSFNTLSSLPTEIGQLTNLTVLNLRSNSLSSLPTEIVQLTNLTELNLSFNTLSSLPTEIGQLTNLTVLNLRSNSLSSLPTEIVQLTNLTELNLSFNTLSSLPTEIGQLTNLTVLNLRSNSLSSLPTEIVQLTNLTELNLSFNTLSSLPTEIGQLTNLTVLNLRSNSLSSLPTEIVQLTNLTVLDLSENTLSSLPAEIGQLTNLTALYLSFNTLSSLPTEIVQLTNLTELNLSFNTLSSLPTEIGQLTNLTVLNLIDNSLPIPPEVIAKYDEPNTIINYYLSLQSNQQKPLHEAKMLLVGQGNVGKTCVRERLIRNQYDPRRNKTDGIDIESWEVEINQSQYQINVWDFGGQEIMHSTHQFFLTKRSLYLLVVDTTLGEEENRIEYWLKIIQSFGKDSPVIIVGNKADQHPLDIDQRGLQNKYPQIKGFYKTSCNKDQANGIPDLKAKVTQEIIQLEHIDDQLPLPWFNVKQQLEELDKDYIPYNQYESICESEEIEQDDNQRILIRLLNDLGVVLNFHDDLRLKDTHILNPEWVTNGVYKILNDHQLIVEHKGILELKMLHRILDPKRYPSSKHLFIIDMMRKFELCFNIEADQKFLIPDILPKEEPDTGEWDNILA